jgi:beta-1,4-mannosyltransferase
MGAISGSLDRKGSINVLFLPDYTEYNPYQRELAQALRRYGVRVTLSNGVGRFPVLGAVAACGKPDVLHLHWTHPFTASRAGSAWRSLAKSVRFLLELLSLKARGTSIVWTMHNLASHERRNWRIETLFNRVCAHLYDHVIVHCRFAERALVQSYVLPRNPQNRVTIIPHGNYIATYENAITSENARQCFGFTQQHTVFLFLGQIRPYKGVLHLIRAFRELDDARARLVIAGKPMGQAIADEVELLCSEDRRIQTRLAFIPDGEIQAHMNAADVVTLPYRDVLNSGGVLLAMSFGKAVIAPRLGCIPEVLDDLGALLYEPDSENGLLHALRQALEADLAAMGRHNLERARQLAWQDIAEKTYQVYRRCLA